MSAPTCCDRPPQGGWGGEGRPPDDKASSEPVSRAEAAESRQSGRLRITNLPGALAASVDAWASRPLRVLRSEPPSVPDELVERYGTRWYDPERCDVLFQPFLDVDTVLEELGRGVDAPPAADDTNPDIHTTPVGASLPSRLGPGGIGFEEPLWCIIGEDPAKVMASDASSGEGWDAYKGEALTGPQDCGWEFAGNELRLLDHPDNRVWWLYFNPSVTWSSALGWHATTASTCTVYIRERCRWRMYFPSRGLIDDPGSTGGFPSAHPQDPNGNFISYPSSNEWRASGHFDGDYVSFVESVDGGKHFPVWGPRLQPTDYDTKTGQPTSWSAGWTESGWTNTCVASDHDAVTPDPDGYYTVYQDVSVVDLKDEIGYYLMILVECRSSVYSASNSCCVDSCDSCARPYTRIVLFASTSPDFTEETTFPTPNDSTVALVLLQPDEGSEGPGGDCPNESYSVPHALATPDRDVLLVYVPWNMEVDTSETPSRVEAAYRAISFWDSDWRGPAWNLWGGISCLAISVDELGAALDLYSQGLDLLEEEDFAGNVYIDMARNLIEDLAAASYQGEVLLTDGSQGDPGQDYDGDAYDRPEGAAWETDCQFCFIDGDLYAFWDSDHRQDPDTATDDRDVLLRARLSTSDEIEARGGQLDPSDPPDYATALSANGDYTLFLMPEACSILFDMRSLFETVPYDDSAGTSGGWAETYRNLLGDPDVAWLEDECLLRVSFGTPDNSQIPGAGQVVTTRSLGTSRPTHLSKGGRP